ncbi:MAG: hypothetical protein QOE74_4516, partial [Mycobacterium sp.]|nr:hypothetical protein [Mycobacterium sp.]
AFDDGPVVEGTPLHGKAVRARPPDQGIRTAVLVQHRGELNVVAACRAEIG